MIYVCKEFALNNNSSVAKLLKYLDKTNQDLVIMPREVEEPPKAGTAQTHVRQVNGTVANVKANGKVIPHSPMELCRLPAGSQISTWSRDHTLQIKRWLESFGLSILSLSRDGDLGIRSTKGSVPIGVILKATYNLSNSTRVGQRSVLCYALTYTGYEAISKAKYLLADYEADWLFFTDQMGNWQLLSRQQRRN
jgi:hypothetical protein